MYKVIIVDDEYLARKLLQGFIEKLPQLELVGTAQNAFEAFDLIKKTSIDIVLLDIHMPDLNGIELARTFHDVPAIIFTTAYSQYALESYEVSAVDYLLKPIDMARFMRAIQKATVRVDAARTPINETHVTTDIATNVGEADDVAKDFIMVKADYKLHRIEYKDLLYIEGQHEYVTFHTTTKNITGLYSLKSLESRLPESQFIRVHKSYIVSISKISVIEQDIVTVSGNKIPIGGSYRDQLMAKLNP